MTKYTKFLAVVVATVLSAVLAATQGDSTISNQEWVNIAIQGVGAFAVVVAPNIPGAAYTKSILAAATAGLVVLSSVITSGVSSTEWIQIVVAALGAVGVFALPNKESA